MKPLFAATLFTAFGLFLASNTASAQTDPDPAAPAYAEQTRQANEGGLRKKKRKASAEDIARMQSRMSMNPEEAQRDQQLEIVEARAGGVVSSNTSLNRAGGRQYEKSSGGFTVRKFKDKRGTMQQKRGQSRPAPGIDPKGKPLKHKKKKPLLSFLRSSRRSS